MNNKGASYGKDMAVGIIILVVFLIFLLGGGFITMFKITQTLKSIPSVVWIFFGAIILIKMLIGGRR